MPKKKPEPTKHYNLGGAQAETDPLLQEAFYDSADYSSIASRDDRRCFLIGRTGAGKSAALKRLEAEHPDHVIRINPEDLSLPYITDLGVIKYLDSLNVHMDSLFIALWKHVLLVEIIRHRYKVDSPMAKANFMQNLREKINRDPSKLAALKYLDDYQGKFWCEADERLKEITHKFEEEITAEARSRFGVANIASLTGDLTGGTTFSKEERAEQAERFQRIVNENQLGRLNQMIGVLDEHILDDQHFTYVVIDDLDREWVDNRVASDLILALFRTVQDLQARVKNLKILVALRTNIFEQLDFASRVGAQEEKLRSLVLTLTWTKTDIENMLDQRVAAVARRGQVKSDQVSKILPARNRSRGNPLDHVLDRTLLRPRDAIAFLNQCIRAASGKARISWRDIHQAEPAYSRDRLLALRDEWKDPYPGLEAVLNVFRGVPPMMSRELFTRRLEDAMLLPATEPSFRGTVWMTEVSRCMLLETGTKDWVELFQPLTALLFRIGFLGCKPNRISPVIFVYNDSEFCNVASNLNETCSFTVHPAFHSALDVAATRDGQKHQEQAEAS